MTNVWDGDFLNRKEDADFLINYLLHRNAVAVAQGERGTSINVSAPWGAGKTFFVNRIAAQLEGTGNRVALVNAWRDDHAEDPIFAVMSSVLKALGKTSRKEKFKEILKNNAGKIAIRAGKGLVSRGAAFVIGQAAVNEITEEVLKSVSDAALESANEYADRALRLFEESQEAIDKFRSELSKEVAEEKPLFVIVDELDRCRPTYAVALLERIKHLFDVPNVIFIAATHSDQLAETIKAVYGQGFDAERYLLRFFDRTYTFDVPSLNEFVAARWTSLGFDDTRILEFRGKTNPEAIAAMATGLGLSLRDVDQCLGILWSLIDLANKNVPFPILFAFPVVAAYQQRRMAIFDHATTDRDLPTPVGYTEYFSDRPIMVFDQIDRYGTNIGVKETASIGDFVSLSHRILHSGISGRIDDSSRVGQYAERYRSMEFDIIYNSTHSPEPVPSMLRQLNIMIRKAGRLST
ncbi:KAP family P-loop NTPase fold protein [Mesorhizobium sophorae]|uniref:KAP family P-loop NTPase fold protein n=1 Tax=Mesorhizobium sophorae TaxID=1300294 RepID=UPI000BA4E129|nr:P-loop NTPase fold protein [Mesorhizobium sophorae]